MDFMLNGQAHGDVATMLMQHNGDPGALKPWIGRDNRTYITVTRNGKKENIVTNAPATLRKDDWITLDQAIIKAAKPRLRVWGDLVGSGNSYTIPGGMASTVLQHEVMGDVNDATISMDGLRQSEGDRPIFDLKNLPLPIIHKDFNFSLRNILASRQGGSPIDTTMAEEAGRKVAEQLERLTLGIGTTYAYGGGTIYGYANHPNRNTKTITNPTDMGWTPATLVNEVLEMRTQSQNDYHFGPWMLYCGLDWDAFMDDDYSAAKGDLTLRERLRRIEGIQDVRTADFLTGYRLLLVQMTSNVARAVIGMNMQTIQWQTQGGMQLNFKVMCILVPQVRADYNNNCGIVDANV
jgi:uncharacterized linocin/CFP29 family protein